MDIFAIEELCELAGLKKAPYNIFFKILFTYDFQNT